MGATIMLNTDQIIGDNNISNGINSSVFYKISFSIREKPNMNMDLLWELILHIKRWLEWKERKKGHIHVQHDIRRWSRLKNRYKMYDAKGNKTFFIDSIQRTNPDDAKDVSWVCRIRECEDGEKRFAPRWWTTEIGFQTRSNGAALLSFVVSYADAVGFIGECMPSPDISVPLIVRNIQQDKRFSCEINDEPLLFEAIELQVGMGMDLKHLIYDPQRRIPIILVMPKKDYVDPKKNNLPVNPNELIRSVAGNALVYYSMDLAFVEEMKYVLDENYKCTAGMIRYYLPNVDTKNPNDALRHRFIHYDEAISMGENSILKIFRRVVAQDANDYERPLFRYLDCEDLIRRDTLQSRINLLKAQHNEEEEMIVLEKEIELEDIKKELKDEKEKNFNLNSTIESMEANYNLLRQGKEALDVVRGLSEYPNSPKDVAEYFSTVYFDKIAFTENGWKSLKECRTSVEILWRAFYSMATTLYDCLGKYNNFSEACRAYNDKSVYECVPGNTSMTNKNKELLREYQDEYNGQLISIASHLKSKSGKGSDPRFFRIYFNNFKDKRTGKRKIVIGSCGEHLTTAGTIYNK